MFEIEKIQLQSYEFSLIFVDSDFKLNIILALSKKIIENILTHFSKFMEWKRNKITNRCNYSSITKKLPQCGHSNASRCGVRFMLVSNGQLMQNNRTTFFDLFSLFFICSKFDAFIDIPYQYRKNPLIWLSIS